MNEDNPTHKDLDEELTNVLSENKGPVYARFALAVLGSVPFAGGAISGIGARWSEKEQANINSVLQAWLQLQQEDLEKIGKTLAEVMIRLDVTDQKILDRIQSQEYLNIIKKCFRDWSASDSEDKRKLLRNLLLNSASTDVSSDDVIKLFIEWISKYSDIHFKVVGILYNNNGYTRYKIGRELYDSIPRDDSPEADLFKLVMHDLSVGHVLRQVRQVASNGQFLKKKSTSRKSSSPYMKSAFDNDENYELTALGQQFVHYTMNEVVTKIEDRSNI